MVIKKLYNFILFLIIPFHCFCQQPKTNFEQIQLLLDSIITEEGTLNSRYECPSCIYDSSQVIKFNNINYSRLQILLDSTLLNISIVRKKEIIHLYNKYLDLIDPNLELFFVENVNRINSCPVCIEDYRLLIIAMYGFERILYSLEFRNKSDKEIFEVYENLSDCHYNDINKTDDYKDKNGWYWHPFYSIRFIKLSSNYISNRSNFALSRSYIEAIKKGLLKKIEKITIDSTNLRKSYKRDYFLIKQSGCFFESNKTPELEIIYDNKLGQWIDNGWIGFVLRTTPRRTNFDFISNLVKQIVYKKIQEGQNDNNYYFRNLVLTTEDQELIRDVLISESERYMKSDFNPAIKYLEKLYDPVVNDFLIKSLIRIETSESNKVLIKQILLFQYENLIQFKESNRDRLFYIR